MSEYPEDLIEKVAKAISPDAWEPEISERHKEFARDQAEAALDALGLREERVWLEGTRRFVTEWEDA